MHPDVLEDMYKAVEHMVYDGELNGCRVSVTLFHDRYQHPFNGGYKDLLCLIRVNGFVCELQFNIDEMLKIKEGTGHTQYEKIRKVNDDLIDAAMKGDHKKLTESLAAEADPNASRDMYGLTALHYVVHILVILHICTCSTTCTYLHVYRYIICFLVFICNSVTYLSGSDGAYFLVLFARYYFPVIIF